MNCWFYLLWPITVSISPLCIINQITHFYTLTRLPFHPSWSHYLPILRYNSSLLLACITSYLQQKPITSHMDTNVSSVTQYRCLTASIVKECRTYWNIPVVRLPYWSTGESMVGVWEYFIHTLSALPPYQPHYVIVNMYHLLQSLLPCLPTCITTGYLQPKPV